MTGTEHFIPLTRADAQRLALELCEPAACAGLAWLCGAVLLLSAAVVFAPCTKSRAQAGPSSEPAPPAKRARSAAGEKLEPSRDTDKLDGSGDASADAAAARVIVISHGLNAHSGHYEWAARQFTSKGLAVYALDHRGRGLSGGERFYV